MRKVKKEEHPSDGNIKSTERSFREPLKNILALRLEPRNILCLFASALGSAFPRKFDLGLIRQKVFVNKNLRPTKNISICFNL